MMQSHTIRIVHSIASLAMQHLGMLAFLIIIIFKTMQQMDYLIRIAYRDSTSILKGGEETVPNQGIL